VDLVGRIAPFGIWFYECVFAFDQNQYPFVEGSEPLSVLIQQNRSGKAKSDASAFCPT
jgi:hypothetical protein